MAKKPIEVTVLKHNAATRRNIPTAEYESVMSEEDKRPVRLAYERRIPFDANGPRATRNRDLDPQLVWRGKDEQDWSDLIVAAPPLYIQEKVHPKVIIDDLKREAKKRADEAARNDLSAALDLFADFNGLRNKEAVTEFYRHDQHWSNRMISGDSLSVMASLAEREGLRGQVQCIYFDPPYGIKFNSNFQWSTTSRDVKDGAKDHITREPEQVRAFRDTWRDGIHSYLTYLRDRLTVARDLLHESGSIFVQIGDENVHRVRAVMDEVFGEENYVSEILVKKKGSQISGALEPVNDFIIWYGRNVARLKFRKLWLVREDSEIFDDFPFLQLESGERLRLSDLSERDKVDYYANYSEFRKKYPSALLFGLNPLKSGGFRANQSHDFRMEGRVFPIGDGQCWKHTTIADNGKTPGMNRVHMADRLFPLNKDVRFVRFSPHPSIKQMSNWWDNLGGASSPIYVVQTNVELIKRCILMSTDPGDLVLDPTCGSGTTAYAAEQWGRRWITIDTSRVAIALARSRLMGARYPYYLLADSPEGQRREGEVTRTAPKTTPTRGDIRHGFVYERARQGTSGAIANNTEIDVIWEKCQPAVEEARAALNAALSGHVQPFKVETGGRAGAKIDFTASGEVKPPSGESAPANGFMEWEIPREAPEGWPQAAKAALTRFWEARIARQKEIDASIAAKAEFEYLYDKPYDDKSRVRVAGPFTVESLSPHRTLAVDWNDELIDLLEAAEGKRKAAEKSDAFTDFAHMILQNLKIAGVQQAHKEDRITFTALTGWPGRFICAEGLFMEGDTSAEGGKRDRAPAGQAAPAEASAQPTAVSAKIKRAGIFIGPEFGTVSRPDLVAAAREAGDAGFDVLIACAFNYDAHAGEFDKLGRVPVLKARMNPDLHMGGDLKATGAGNLFVIFGEPDVKIEDAGDGLIRVKVFGVDVFKPQTGEVVSEGTDGIALWMLDTDYNEESFFVRHAYFLGANDPYKALKTTLKAEIDQEAWDSLYSDTSRPFAKPKSGRIAVKVINHLGDEVMKVFSVE